MADLGGGLGRTIQRKPEILNEIFVMLNAHGESQQALIDSRRGARRGIH